MKNTTFTVHLFNDAGHTDPAPRLNQVRVLPDKPPTVELLKPPRQGSAAPGDDVPVMIRAGDDHGIGRVRLEMSITPFQQRPSIDIEILDSGQQRIAMTSVVEATELRMSLTMHLKGPAGPGTYTARAVLFYPPSEPVDQAEIVFSIPAADSPSTK